ncbi:MAG: methyltransferase domain-containing protein [Pseudonocardiaceae bacterium]
MYSDTALTTQLGQINPGSTLRPLTVSARSSTKPTLMARMLADLHAHPGHRVLEIGTGTGYNAALLCHQLDQRNVCSVDVHPGLVDTARARLASLGMLVGLTVADDGTASGHFLDYPGLFMILRRAPDRMGRPAELTPEQLPGARQAVTTLDPAVLADPAFAFFCQLHLGSGRSSHHVINNATRATVVTHDGSWAETTCGSLVTFNGTHNPWQTVETAHQRWTQLGQPQPSALGLTVTPDRHYVWCQHPDSDWTHPLR